MVEVNLTALQEMIAQLDEEGLKIAFAAFKDRRAQLTYAKAQTIRKWDRVRIVACKPAYMEGAIGTVTRANITTVTVDFDEPRGKFFKRVRVPVVQVVKI